MFSKKLHKRDDKKFDFLRDFVCNTTKNELERHPEIQTIAMVELKNNFPLKFSREILKCLPDNVAKVILKPHNNFNGNSTISLPKSSIVIFIADDVKELDSAIWIFFKQLNPSTLPIVHHLSKFMVLTSKENDKILEISKEFQILNFALIYYKNFNIHVKISNWMKKYQNQQQILFPNKLKDLERFELRIGLEAQHGSSVYKNGIIYNELTHFVDIVAHKLNATVKYVQVVQNISNYSEFLKIEKKKLRNYFLNRQLDLYIETFDFNGEIFTGAMGDLCFVVPMPPKFSIYELILILPFDKSVWMWLWISFGVSALIWWIYKLALDIKIQTNFLFGIFTHFVGQSANFRVKNIFLKTFLQVLIFLIFILSNGYQSLVTSFMLRPVEQKFLKSIDELLDSNFNIFESNRFSQTLLSNPKYQKALSQNRVSKFEIDSKNPFQQLADLNFAILQPCERFTFYINYDGDGESAYGFYLIPEVVTNWPVRLKTGYSNPFVDKFQQLMDKSFEAGLSNLWKKFFYQDVFEFKFKTIKDEAKILDFSAIAPFFLILVFGFLISLFIFLCEIFYFDCLSQFSYKYLKDKIRKIRRRKS